MTGRDLARQVSSAVGEPARPVAQHAEWRWATTQAQLVLNRGDLGTILRFYRRVHGLNQTDLGALLGYDKTYVSALELGKRRIDDVPSLRHIATQLQLPPHTLGVTDPADADHRAMIQFGASTVRLAEIARQTGHASEAVSELWPLVARLEARLEDGHAERVVLHLLGRARIGLGVALGNVLPEERLGTAATWTLKGLSLAAYTDDPDFTGHALRMHGNECRKAGLRGAAVDRLTRAVAFAPTDAARAAALPLLARAAGVLGNAPLFDQTMQQADRLLDHVTHTSLFNPFALHEIRLRGLADTGRVDVAIQLTESSPAPTLTVAPQWRVIELVTVAGIMLAAHDLHGATTALDAAVSEATAQRLPHQLQRVIRTAEGRLPEVQGTAADALERLRSEMAA
ncbi:helix-turn-helix domain-containing protein [Streptomyces sp. NPDC056132]|uniref:helix-turn-helix domain-containing protein n=1 Tax=Streptomyces sp. NPDC056132 TaxID=3345722 RepID=UPI0035D94EDF